MIVPLAAAVKPSRLRTLVEGCVLIFVAAGVTQTWLIDGLVIPYQVAGSSMAGMLLGVHREVVCGACGCPFSCGTDFSPAAPRAVCPNCGYPANDLESLPDVGGDYVLIDRTAFSIRPPRRWEIVAFRRSSQADRVVVKRIVGLPGESIEIRHGDVYADGRLLRKNLAQQRALAILVHDAAFEPRGVPQLACPTVVSPLLDKPAVAPSSRRWRAERSDTHWSAIGGGFTHAAGREDEPIDWLAYHHWRQSPVTDLCAYNPWQPRREEDVNPVSDLMLSFRLGYVSGNGTFRVRIRDGRDTFEARLKFEGDQARYRGFRNDLPLADARGKMSAASGERLVEVSLVDQQFLLALDGQTLLACSYERPEPPQLPPSCPLAIGVQGLKVAVAGLRLYRDVYYTDLVGARGHGPSNQPMRLSAGQYYVLGDNSPVSEDSRRWPPREVDAKLLVGKPLVVVGPARLSLGGWWHFQVPNSARIRYIW